MLAYEESHRLVSRHKEGFRWNVTREVVLKNGEVSLTSVRGCRRPRQEDRVSKGSNNIMHLKRQKDSRMTKAQNMNFLKDHMFFPVKSQGHLMQTAILHFDFM